MISDRFGLAVLKVAIRVDDQNRLAVRVHDGGVAFAAQRQGEGGEDVAQWKPSPSWRSAAMRTSRRAAAGLSPMPVNISPPFCIGL